MQEINEEVEKKRKMGRCRKGKQGGRQEERVEIEVGEERNR